MAALAAFASTSAMADLKITGTFDPTFSRITTNLADSVDVVQPLVGNDGLGTQGVKFAVTEDLGNGLTALGMYEHNFTNAGTTGRGEYYAALSADFGTVRLGAPNTVSLTAQGLSMGGFGTKLGGRTAVIPRNAAGAGLAGSVTDGLNLVGLSLTRFNSSIQYISPNLSGLTVQATYAPSASVDGDTSVGTILDLGVVYAAGPLAAAVTYFSSGATDYEKAATAFTLDPATGSIEGNTAVNKTEAFTQITAGAKYNLGVAVIGAGFHQFTYDKSTQTGMRVAVDFPLSEQLTLTGTYQNATFNDEWGALDDEVYTQFAVGAQYKLSKTTTAYGRFVSGSAKESESTGSGILAGLLVNF